MTIVIKGVGWGLPTEDYVVLRDVDPTAMSVDTVTADGDSPMTSAGSSPQVSEEVVCW